MNMKVYNYVYGWITVRNVSRSPCPVCGSSRKYYCYDCYVLVGVSKHLVPSVTLPVKVDMWAVQRKLVFVIVVLNMWLCE